MTNPERSRAGRGAGRPDLDEAASLADELGISRSEARRLIATDDGARKRRESRQHHMPERAIPYDDKETR